MALTDCDNALAMTKFSFHSYMKFFKFKLSYMYVLF